MASDNFTISVTNSKNAILQVLAGGNDYSSNVVIASNASDKSKVDISFSELYTQQRKHSSYNINITEYPNTDFVPSERPYATVKYIDDSGAEQSMNVPFDTVTLVTESSDISSYWFDIQMQDSSSFAIGGYGIYYDPVITVENLISIDINLLAGEETSTISDYGLFYVYKTNLKELGNLSDNRFKLVSDEYYYEEIDLSGYITSLIEYPFTVNATKEQALILGNVATQINSHIVDEYIITTSFEIEINGNYKDNRDIGHSIITCHFPFTDDFDIDSQYVNTTIKAEYQTDILTNASVLNVYSNNVLVYSTTCLIGYKLPYTIYNNQLNELTDNLRFKNQACTITVKQKLNNSTRFGTLKKDTLKNFSGYVRTNEHINIDSSKMMNNELQSIKQLLQGGILINAN